MSTPLKPLNLREWLKIHGGDASDEATNPDSSLATPSPALAAASPGLPRNAGYSPTTTNYSAAALAGESDSVAHAKPGGRNHQLNKSAFKLYGLVGAGALSKDEVDRSLTFAATSAGLDPEEIRKVLASAWTKGSANVRSMAHVGNGVGQMDFHEYNEAIMGGHTIVFDEEGEAVSEVQPTTNGRAVDAEPIASPTSTSPSPPTSICPVGLEDNPHRLAQLFARRMQHPDGLRLRFWRDEFYWWDGAAYRQVPPKEIRAELTQFIADEFMRLFQKELIAYKMKAKARGADQGEGGGGGGEEKKSAGRPAGPPKPIPVTTRLVGDVLQALSGVTLLSASRYPYQPAWIDKKDFAPPWPAAELLPAKNAIVHLPSAVAGLPCMLDATPLFFSSYSLGYPFDPTAPAPTAWLAFLDQLWGDDRESIDTLQEWMGYLLTSDTSMQKMFVLTGPMRSGKGTIARVIRMMVGEENIVNPTLGSLSTQFGLEPLLNKTIAIITDARISSRTDTSVAIERLLAISGEDSQTVSRKHTSSITTNLSTRFTLISNLVPQLQDASGALASRMIFLNLTNSFLGKEDRRLFDDKLVPELPGILRWSIEGWARLKARGYFNQPESGEDEKELMEDLSSPISAYIKDCCEQGDGPEYVTLKSELYASWVSWCTAKGIKSPGTQEVFGRNLRSVLPRVKYHRPRKDGKSVHAYGGVRVVGSIPAAPGQHIEIIHDDTKQTRIYERQEYNNEHRQYKDREDYDD